MITLNDTALNDNQVVWVFRLITNSTTIYFGSELIQLNSTYSGDVILKDSLQSVEKYIDLSQGGGIGEIGSLRLSLARFSGNSDIDGFLDEFYPNNSEYLVPATLQMGIVWQGAQNDADITWLYKFYVHSYSYQYESIDLECFEIDELESIELPYYTVQKDYDNGISYYDNAPEDVYGKHIPMVYGSFSLNEGANYQSPTYAFLPTLLVEQEKQTYLISYNRLSVLTNLYKYESQFDTKMRIYGLAGGTSITSINTTHAGSYITLVNTAGNIYGDIELHPKVVTENSDYNSIKNLIDFSSSSYLTIAAGNKAGCGFNAEDVKASFNSVEDRETNFKVKVIGYSSTPLYLTTAIYDRRDGSGVVSDSSIALTTTSTTHTVTPFIAGTDLEWEDILNYELTLYNNNANGNVYIYETWIEIDEIKLAGIYEPPKEIVTIKLGAYR